MNPQTCATSGALFPQNMSNVIDSLKRLERIGSEESQTVQKILEAAREISERICECFPESCQDRPIYSFVDDNGNVTVRRFTGSSISKVVVDGVQKLKVMKPRYVFGVYVVQRHIQTRLALQTGEQLVFVGSDRDTALAFSKDIANGLLDAIAQFIEAEHKASQEGLDIIAAAAKELATLGKTRGSKE